MARDLAGLADGTVFEESAAAKLERMQVELRPLAGRYDVVVANPPYMGSSSLGPWMSAWVKKRYPDEKSDLCTSFIERGFTLSRDDGANAMITMQSWMFLSSYEKMRGKLLRNHSILSMAHLGTRAFGAIAGEVVSTTATVFGNAGSDAPGAYFRLVDMGGEDEKRAGYLEALADPGCGWFCRTSAIGFNSIPGTPIAYWASSAALLAFENGTFLSEIADPRKGLATTDNARFLRLWHEVETRKMGIGYRSAEEALQSSRKWFPLNKGGDYRKWYGNTDYLVNWENNGQEMKNAVVSRYNGGSYTKEIRSELHYFSDSITWSALTSSCTSFRRSDYGALFDSAGSSMFPSSRWRYYLAFSNSSVAATLLSFINPTLNFGAGSIGNLPVMDFGDSARIDEIVESNIGLAKRDWNSFEQGWEFRRHPLI